MAQLQQTLSFPQMNGTNYNQSIGKSIQFDHSVAIRWCSKNLEHKDKLMKIDIISKP